MAAIAELNHDKRGLVWPEIVSPYTVHLVSLNGAEARGESVYQALIDEGVEVLWDDREGVSAGVKFGDADLIGCTHRLLVSKKTGEQIEYKLRSADDAELMSLDEAVKRLKGGQHG